MDKTITTALMIVISMVMALMLYNVAYPAVAEGGDAITSMTGRTEDRMRTQITIVHGSSELDNDGWWQDTNSNGEFEVFFWVKNTGETRVVALDELDVFFGPEGNYTRIPHQSDAVSFPYWTWQLENASEWVQSSTLRITIHYGLALSQGQYFIKVTLPNSIRAESFLGM